MGLQWDRFGVCFYHLHVSLAVNARRLQGVQGSSNRKNAPPSVCTPERSGVLGDRVFFLTIVVAGWRCARWHMADIRHVHPLLSPVKESSCTASQPNFPPLFTHYSFLSCAALLFYSISCSSSAAFLSLLPTNFRRRRISLDSPSFSLLVGCQHGYAYHDAYPHESTSCLMPRRGRWDRCPGRCCAAARGRTRRADIVVAVNRGGVHLGRKCPDSV